MAVAEIFERPLRPPPRLRACSSPAAGDRMAWVDAAKGAAILLVVVGHAWRGMSARGLVPDPLFAALDTRIYAMHMPVFFALSGMFYAATLARNGPLAFTGGRVMRLVWPMVLWTYLFLGLKLLAGGAANQPVVLADLMIWPVPGHLHLWFLWALFLLHIGFALTRPLLRNGRYPAFALAGLGLGAAALALAPLSRTADHWVGAACHYAPVFVLGIILGQTGLLAKLNRAMGSAAALAALGLLALWPSLPAAQPVLTLAVTGAVLAAFAGLGAGRRVPGWLVTLGTGSMAIYLGHTPFSAGFREACLAFGITDMSLHVIVGTLAGLIGPLVLLAAARRTGTLRFFGFDTQNRSVRPGPPTVRRTATKPSSPRI